MKILFVITGLNYGGAEKVLFTLCQNLSKRGYNIKVVSVIPAVNNMIAEFIDKGVSVEVLKVKPNIKGIFNLSSSLRKLRQIISEFSPDIVHAHMFHANMMSRITSTGSYVLINTTHNNNTNRVRNFLYKLTDRKVNVLTTVSEEGRQNYHKYTGRGLSDILYLPNFVDADFFRKSEESRKRYRSELKLDNKFVWIAIAKFRPQKDYPNLLQAFRLLKQQHPDHILIIVGKGPLEQEIKTMIQELQIEDSVLFLGLRKDIPELLSTSDAYVMSSAWEGQPIALLEAASSQLPIVATNVGGNSTIVTNEENGFLVSPRDYEGLCKAMAAIAGSTKEKIAQMGMASRQTILKKYSIEKVIGQYISIYETVLKMEPVHGPG